MQTIDIVRTDIASMAPDIAPLLEASWAERTDGSAKYKLQPNMDAYCALEDQGLLHLFVARKGAELVGYLSSIVTPRLHAIGETVASVDALYVLPAHRSGDVASRLLTFGENALRLAGVHTVLFGTNRPHVMRWLQAWHGYVHVENILEKGL